MKTKTYVMNMLTLIVLAFIGLWSITTLIIEDIHKWAESTNAKEISTFDKMLNAIEFVESGCNADAIGDGGNAVGSFQIWKIFVRDCNRIFGEDKYTYEDRKSRVKSREMATIYLNHYGGTTEEMVRKFNGGPQGHKKKATEAYWLKVKTRMESAK